MRGHAASLHASSGRHACPTEGVTHGQQPKEPHPVVWLSEVALLMDLHAQLMRGHDTLNAHSNGH